MCWGYDTMGMVSYGSVILLGSGDRGLAASPPTPLWAGPLGSVSRFQLSWFLVTMVPVKQNASPVRGRGSDLGHVSELAPGRAPAGFYTQTLS